MEEKQINDIEMVEENITPRFVLEAIYPIVKDEFIAKCRLDRTGIRMTFCNGQKFQVFVKEI